MIIKTNIIWRDYQKKTIRDIIDISSDTSRQSVFVLCSPRQNGKTTVCENLLLYFAVNYKDSFSMFVSPTYKQARKVFIELKKAVECSAVFNTANESSMEITFVNGSKIAFSSGESSISALQGYTIKHGILIFDESAYLQDCVFQALFPAVDVYKCPVVLASTPRFKEGLFYEYYRRGEENYPDVYSFNWKGYSLLSKEKLDFYRETLPANVFRNYYLGEFSSYGDGVFGDFSSCLYDENYIPAQHSPGDKLYMGVDFGACTGNDDTAVCIFDANKNMRYLTYFNKLDETETVDRLVSIVNEWQPYKVTMELNSIGRIFYGLFNKKCNTMGLDINIRGINTTNDSKQRQVQKLQVAIQSESVKFIYDKKFISQMNNFSSKLTGTGKIQYAAAKNGHDDTVLATMIAFDSIDNAVYKIL